MSSGSLASPQRNMMLEAGRGSSRSRTTDGARLANVQRSLIEIFPVSLGPAVLSWTNLADTVSHLAAKARRGRCGKDSASKFMDEGLL